VFDRVGAGHQLSVGYRGTRDLIFAIGNLIIADHEQNRQPTPDTWRPEHVPAKRTPVRRQERAPNNDPGDDAFLAAAIATH